MSAYQAPWPATAKPWPAPPQPDRADGHRRRVGVELEFAGLSVAVATEATQMVFGGTITWQDSHRTVVEGTAFGTFRVELDMSLAHRPLDTEAERALRDAVVDLSSVVVPVEIVCPPMAWDAAHRLDDLRELLQRMGAEGTREGLLYAFGAQLNPEPPSLEIDTLLATFRAFLLLRDWLRSEILVDPLRRLWRFADPFPSRYIALVLDDAYRPALPRFIDDYLAYNPTRDRELDLLPLCLHLDAARVRAVLPYEKINARPTWHYRLPNSEIDRPDWTIGLEWSRWLRVEQLAERPDLLAAASRLWRRNDALLLPDNWTPHSIALAGRL